ncbi:MAG: HAD hydrolase-like protein [Terriglobia bacterium]|nr:HAD hydrolase-like protein [Terriglobia bacterium]
MSVLEPTRNGAQTLLIDADDTLWENNVYFERAIANFISFLEHKELSAAEVRGVLNEVERDCIVSHGYGLNSFVEALVRTFERVSVEPLTPALRETIHGFARTIAEHPVEVIRGVQETLGYLHPRHHLILVTKGNFTEQTGKVERSGLKQFFAAVEVVPEKDAEVYEGLVEKYALARQSTWMIGNSPRSDINPALAAGLNAIFIPHAQTWVLEHEEIERGIGTGKLLELESFGKLREQF